jgi:hypothetical protein
MRLADLPPATHARIKARRWDRIIEKHEGPEPWESTLRYNDVDFLEIGGHLVLLPIDRAHHANITILRCLTATAQGALTIFLKDTTYVSDPAAERFAAGFVAVCERLPGEEFFLATLYHEWFILDEWT